VALLPLLFYKYSQLTNFHLDGACGLICEYYFSLTAAYCLVKVTEYLKAASKRRATTILTQSLKYIVAE
jgi:hypothetical protein